MEDTRKLKVTTSRETFWDMWHYDFGTLFIIAVKS
jgi:hypothetical protein